MPGPDFFFEIHGIKTLPIYTAMAVTKEAIQGHGSGRARIEYVDPAYTPRIDFSQPNLLELAESNANFAIKIVSKWREHFGQLAYFIQFSDEDVPRKFGALATHTRIISTLCDARLHIDTATLWRAFDHLHLLHAIHQDYRRDKNRDEKWGEYADRLAKAHEASKDGFESIRLLERIERQIEMNRHQWAALSPPRQLVDSANAPGISLFYSYSHKDEILRDSLAAHLSVLQRNGVIKSWHDRRIVAGNEWKGKIDDNLRSSQIILLLISADFLSSDYCYDVEMKLSLERHRTGSARVIPVILRACDWTESQFSSLQALPKDALPVTSWPNIDEAFTNVAKGIRQAVSEHAGQRKATA